MCDFYSVRNTQFKIHHTSPIAISFKQDKPVKFYYLCLSISPPFMLPKHLLGKSTKLHFQHSTPYTLSWIHFVFVPIYLPSYTLAGKIPFPHLQTKFPYRQTNQAITPNLLSWIWILVAWLGLQYQPD